MLSIEFGSRSKPLKITNIHLYCYILENKQKVITRDSVQKVLGYEGKSENWLLELLTTINQFTPIHSELLFELKTPLSARMIVSDSEKVVYDLLEAPILVQSCLAILKAKEEGFLNVNQLKFAKSASIVLEKIQNTTIENLIDEATGLIRHREKSIEKVIQTFLNQQNDNAYNWIRTISIDFIERILDLHHLDWKTIFHNPYSLAEIINEIIFSRISIEILDDLRKLNPKRVYKRKNNKKQDNEHIELKKYIIVLESLLMASENNWSIFLQLLNKAFPVQKNRITLNFNIEKVTTKNILSVFNETLIKSSTIKSFGNNKKTQN
ncbi:P63C domain-containing protein [Flavobacterium luteum]|uniref:Uncharacterized protein n=1 Tax=Flavobacterium luteum TaxID=2026654 RepID=A0A7J5AF40_9FLAO|nr:P63C domain-containing protein [Flavobacterium luteum]KAB1156068.1 hypothetical protein F6464_07655 [Flavobacterium luteum]